MHEPKTSRKLFKQDVQFLFVGPLHVLHKSLHLVQVAMHLLIFALFNYVKLF